MLSPSAGTRRTTVAVLGPPSVASELREVRSSVEATVAVERLDGLDATVPETVDCVVAATRPAASNGSGTPGTADAVDRATDVFDRATELARREPAPPVVILAPAAATVAEPLRAGVAECLPRSTLERAPSTVLRRVLGAAERRRAATDCRAIFDGVAEPLSLHDPDTGELVHANRRLCDLLGYDPAEIAGASVAEYTADVPGYDRTAVTAAIAAATDGADSVEWPLEAADGERLWVEASLRPVEVGGRVLVLSTAAEVSDRRRRFEAVTELMDEVVYLVRADLSEVLFVNDAYTELFGQPAERVYEDPLAVLETVHPDDREAYRADLMAMGEHVRSGADGPYEFSHRLRVDGETRWVQVTGHPSRGPGGTVDRVVGVIRDVTERVRREREYEEIFHGVNDAIAVHDPDTGEIVDVNDSYLDLFGHDREAILETSMDDLSATDEGYTGERARALIREVAESGTDETVEWRIETAAGERRTVESNLTVAAVGGERRVLSMIRDVTERRRREREFEQIFNAVDDPITIHDPDTGEHVRVNDGFCDLLGYSREEIAGMSVEDYSVTEEGYTTERAREFVRSVVEAGEPRETEWVVETSAGERRWLRVRGTTAEIGGERRFVSIDRDITERKRREREYEQIFDGVSDAITVHDPETADIVDANETYVDLLGYDRETILEEGIDGLSATDEGYTGERARNLIRRVDETGDPETVEWVVERRDGERRTIEANVTIAEIGGERRVLSMQRDVTERRRREREYEQIFHGVNDAIAVFDPGTGEIVDVNDPYRALLGYDDLERIRELGIDGLSATDEGYTAERGRRLVREVARTGEPKTVEWKGRRRDGEHVWLEVTLATAAIGGERRVLSIQRDVTERKRREREYEQIFHGVPSPIAINDPETGALLDVNDTMCELLGYDRETILALGVEGLSADEEGYDGDRATAIVRRVMESGEPETFEWKLETAAGGTRVLEVTGTPAEIGGEPRYVSLTRDITERRRREREFEQIFHGVTDVIGVYHPETAELLDVNETMCDLLGYDRGTILAMDPAEITATELGFDAETIGEVVREVAATGEPALDIEWALRTASGEALWLEVNATPAEINGERRVVTIARDVTGRRDREERVQVLNRVLRHNLRNDVDAVRAYATAIEEAVGRDRVRAHAGRVREIADDLLALSGKARAAERMLRGGDRREARPIGAVLQSVVAGARDAHGDATFELTCEASHSPVEAGVFRLVVREIVENAAEHAGDSPSIEVRASTVPDDGELAVTVADDGPGIPDRVLTPFRAGGETQFRHNHGLGLWLVNWGVRRLGGGIEFERPAGGGTVARLRLPGRGD